MLLRLREVDEGVLADPFSLETVADGLLSETAGAAFLALLFFLLGVLLFLGVDTCFFFLLLAGVPLMSDVTFDVDATASEESSTCILLSEVTSWKTKAIRTT